jgi:MoxR-like ATPase
VGERPEAIRSSLGPADLLALQRQADQQHCSEALLDYVLDFLERSRQGEGDGLPLSPRAGLALVAAARAWSLLEGRDHVIPDDVQAVLEPVCEHRLDGGRGTGLACPGRPGQYSRALQAAINGLR